MSDELLASFRDELLALVASLEADLLELDERSTPEQISNVFRGAHNLKSAAAMLGLDAAADATHAMESVLEELRSGRRAVDRSVVTSLLGQLDGLRALVDSSSAQAPLVRERLYRVGLRCSADALTSGIDPVALLYALSDLGAVVSSRTDDSRLPPLEELDPHTLYLTFELVLRTASSPDEIRAVFLFAEDRIRLDIAELTHAEERPMASMPVESGERIAPETLAVSVRRIDTLMNLAAELSIATSHLEQLRSSGIGPADRRMAMACQEVRSLGSKLQEAAISIRLVPLAATFAVLRRFVRDQALRLGKEVSVELQGAFTELDKSVAERLLDPLMHLVRNALDHGLETPDERQRAGKAPRGLLRLAARQQHGQLVLAVEDDGRGLDAGRIREVAMRRGLVPQGSAPAEAELLELIFTPGFSTADQAGNLSGRGVGLDVVRQNVSALGGEVWVESEPYKGCRFLLRVPLTLVMLEGLIVQCGGEPLVIPLDVVKQLVRPAPGQIAGLPDGREVLRLPSHVVPLLRPTDFFGFGSADPPRGAVAVVVDTAIGPVALCVDEVISQESVLLKGLHRSLRFLDATLGAALLGDGRLALVLDVAQLAARARQERLGQASLVARLPLHASREPLRTSDL